MDVRDAERSLHAQVDALGDRVASGVYMLAETAMSLSKASYVPVITGYLRSTGYVKQPTWQGRQVSVELGYSASYARAVHDAPPERGQGKNQYLWRPAVEVATTGRERLERWTDTGWNQAVNWAG